LPFGSLRDGIPLLLRGKVDRWEVISFKSYVLEKATMLLEIERMAVLLKTSK
jgi:hypothetical protein